MIETLYIILDALISMLGSVVIVMVIALIVVSILLLVYHIHTILAQRKNVRYSIRERKKTLQKEFETFEQTAREFHSKTFDWKDYYWQKKYAIDILIYNLIVPLPYIHVNFRGNIVLTWKIPTDGEYIDAEFFKPNEITVSTGICDRGTSVKTNKEEFLFHFYQFGGMRGVEIK